VKNILFYIAYFAGALFIILGIAILVMNWVPANYGNYKIIMASVLILYGIFRIVVTYTKQKNSKGEGSNYE